MSVDDALQLTAHLNVKSCPSQRVLKLSCEPSGCGVKGAVSPQRSQIIGGSVSQPREWPWMAYVINLGKMICGGSIVNDRWILTAAHCFANDRFPLVYASIRVGSNTPEYPGSLLQTRNIRRIVLHKNYRTLPVFSADIALVELDRPLNLGENVQPVCLPREGVRVNESSVCYVSGLGNTRPFWSSNYPVNLRHMRTKVLNDTYCEEEWSLAFEGKICSGFEYGLPQPCSGDNGGPLMCLSPQGYWEVHGVVSFGIRSCPAQEQGKQRYKPDVYTRVSAYTAWIDDVISGRL
ncbi:chymotrypsin-like elastase family member 2A [Liolophura sinensis]|uniref:chymotrypsin-like elastase family member 2A n=1 Tax=Liolophura sinensis TaxID=3198878 RepID=UPI00315919B2